MFDFEHDFGYVSELWVWRVICDFDMYQIVVVIEGAVRRAPARRVLRLVSELRVRGC